MFTKSCGEQKAGTEAKFQFVRDLYQTDSRSKRYRIGGRKPDESACVQTGGREVFVYDLLARLALRLYPAKGSSFNNPERST